MTQDPANSYPVGGDDSVPETNDTAQTASHIEPVLIETKRRHSFDPNRRRATFQVPYPSLEIVLERSTDVTNKLPPRFESTGRKAIVNKRLFLAVSNLVLRRSDFKECKFNRRNREGESRIVGASFVDCHFDLCIFGGTIYRQVRFEDCKFQRCDFGMAQFVDCEFQACEFVECTGEHVSFSATEIDPERFLLGLTPPHYNYESVDARYDGEPSREMLEADWKKIRRALAAQLLKSNGEIYHTLNHDAALAELKRAELKVRRDSLKSKPFFRSVPEAARCLFLYLVLVGTRGGTSVARLAGIASCAILVYAALLSVSSVEFLGQSCRLLEFTFVGAVDNLARATSLFLAIGFTAFRGQSVVETVLLTSGAMLGLIWIWYALLASVVVRRVYR